MFILKKFHGDRFKRFNSIVESVYSHLISSINLVGSATIPLPEVCQATSIPGSAIRVEGHVSSRYFPRTEPIDKAEIIAEQRVIELFNLTPDYKVSVQPHSATQSNHIVWNSFLGKGDIVYGLSLNDGGHISHTIGLPNGVNFEPFPISSSGIDYDQLAKAIRTSPPKMIIAGASSYPLSINYQRLSEITKGSSTHLHADIAHMAPYIAAGQHPNVIPHADTITIDTGKNLRGPKGGVIIYRSSHEKIVKRSIFPVGQSSPNQSAILAKACIFEYWEKKILKNYAKKLIEDANTLAYVLKKFGLNLVFEGTDSHLILIDVGKLGMTGKDAEIKLEKENILSNRNAIPNESRPPWIGSGLRLGTSVLTILGYKEQDIKRLGEVISKILLGQDFDASITLDLLEKYHVPIVAS